MGLASLPGRRVVLVPLLIATLSGCRRPDPGASAPPPGPTPVTVAPVEVRELTPTEEFPARVDASETVEVRPRVSGYLAEVRFQAGQQVRAGDVLFVINPHPMETALQLAEARLQQARAAAETSSREASRGAQLLRDRTISAEENDARQWRAKEAEAAVLAAEATRRGAQINLDYCQVRSPIDGRITRTLVTPGNNVSGVDGFTTLLATVVRTDPVHVYAAIEERALLEHRRLEREGRLERTPDGHVAVSLEVADGKGFVHRGALEHLDPRVDPNTGTGTARGVFPNPDGALVPGLYGRLRVPVGPRARKVLVPEVALGTEQSLRYVWAVTSSNTAHKAFVTLGASVDGLRVVERGLAPSDRIVVQGIQRVLAPGMPLAPEAPAPAPGKP